MACGLWQRRWDLLLVQVTVAGSFLFWLGTSPLIRYGCVYVYLTSAVVWGSVYEAVLYSTENGGAVEYGAKADETGDGGEAGSDAEIVEAGDGSRWQRFLRGLGLAAAALFLVYKGCALGGKIVSTYTDDYWLAQKDYENYETMSYEINGVTFYYPVSGDQVGYESFPSAPAKTQVTFLGADVRDGFCSAE
jgi:hypothetical protein